jgi:hypothetical protein
MGFLLHRMGKGRQVAFLGLHRPVQQELVGLIPPASPITLRAPGSAHLPRRLGLHRFLLHEIYHAGAYRVRAISGEADVGVATTTGREYPSGYSRICHL